MKAFLVGIFSHAYDYITFALQPILKGTHEIVPEFLIGNKYVDWRPRNVW